MSFTYHLHPQIEQDYDEGYTWYEDKQEGLGNRFTQAVRKKIQEIVARPEKYGSRENKLYREARVDRFPYLVVYKFNKRRKEIYIVSVHHMSKDTTKYRK